MIGLLIFLLAVFLALTISALFLASSSLLFNLSYLDPFELSAILNISSLASSSSLSFLPFPFFYLGLVVLESICSFFYSSFFSSIISSSTVDYTAFTCLSFTFFTSSSESSASQSSARSESSLYFFSSSFFSSSAGLVSYCF